MPGSAHMFAVTDYSGTVTLWDARSPNVPLGRSEAHGGKALCLHWLTNAEVGGDSGNLKDGYRLLTGGSDCCIKSTAVDSSGNKGGEEGMDTAEE